MVAFTMQTRAAGPVEEVWKLLHDPASFPRWWSGTETVAPGPDGSFTQLTPDGEQAVIDAYVEIPDTKVHRLEAQRLIVAESLANLAALAAAIR